MGEVDGFEDIEELRYPQSKVTSDQTHFSTMWESAVTPIWSADVLLM